MIFVIAAFQAATPPASQLADLRMHLFYTESGRLSPDISPPHAAAGWNRVVSEGSADEHADDLVIVAEIRTVGEQYIERPLRIVARGPNSRILGQRRFNGILTSEAGRAYLPLWLNDVTCAGDIVVTVTYGSETRTETLQMRCGE